MKVVTDGCHPTKAGELEGLCPGDIVSVVANIHVITGERGGIVDVCTVGGEESVQVYRGNTGCMLVSSPDPTHYAEKGLVTFVLVVLIQQVPDLHVRIPFVCLDILSE